jgi:hypothetical protein
MAWLVCFICGLVGSGLVLLLGDWLVAVFGVSTFEGGAGYLFVFFFTPLAFVCGVIIGALTVWRIGPSGYFKVQSLALLLTVAAFWVVIAVAYQFTDHPPRIDGHKLAVDFELRLPKTIGPNDKLEILDLETAMYGADGFASAYGKLQEARNDADGTWVIPGQVALLAQDSKRSLKGHFRFADGNYCDFTFNLALPAQPASADEAWSGWFADRDSGDPSSAAQRTHQRPMLRYRVQVMP